MIVDTIVADLTRYEREYLSARWSRGISLIEVSREPRYPFGNPAIAWPRKQIASLIRKQVLRMEGENSFALTPLGQDVVRALRELAEAQSAAKIWRDHGD